MKGPLAMYYLNVWLTVQDPANIDRVRDALRRAGGSSQTEPGCVRWEAHQSQADPAKFLLVETWGSKADWETHRQAYAVQEIYLKEVIPLVTRDAHPCERIV